MSRTLKIAASREGWVFQMPKSSGYAIAFGVDVRPGPPTEKNPDRREHGLASRRVADVLYLQLETFLDSWRRQGLTEDVVRTALARAERASLAMELVTKRLKGQ